LDDNWGIGPAAGAGRGSGGNLATAEFEYHLPPGRIARYPSQRRADSRLLVLRLASGRIEHRRFRHLPSLMEAGDLLVVNDTRVFPARLLGRKPTGAAGEVLLPGVEKIDDTRRPRRRLRAVRHRGAMD